MLETTAPSTTPASTTVTYSATSTACGARAATSIADVRRVPSIANVGRTSSTKAEASGKKNDTAGNRSKNAHYEPKMIAD
jgi:hypothetical protein